MPYVLSSEGCKATYAEIASREDEGEQAGSAAEQDWSMKIVALLQNQWFKNAARAQSILDKCDREERQATSRAWLFMGCLTGRRILKAFGDDLAHEIIYENASPKLGSKASDCYGFDADHVRSFLETERPDVLLVFGKVAKAAVDEVMAVVPYAVYPIQQLGHIAEHGIGQPDYFSYGTLSVVFGPHPAARQAGVVGELQRMAKTLKGLLCHTPTQS